MDTTEATRTDEGRYRLLVEAIIDYAIYMLDPAGIVTSWNAGARKFKGYEASEIIGQHFSRFYTPEERAAGVAQKALECASTEGRFETEGWRVRKDGSHFWTHVVIDAIRSPAGELLGYAKITRDLSERRAADAALKRSEEQFRLLVQGVTDYAIYMLDVEGHVASWNVGAQRIKGYLPEEIVGQHFSRFYLEAEQGSGLPQRNLEIAAREGRFEDEGWRVRKDGSRFWANVVIDAIRNDQGDLIGFAKITRDVTEKREAQRALDEAREALFQDAQARAAAEAEARQHHILSIALHNMTNGLVMVDPEGLISLYNDRAREMLRLDPEDISIGMPIAEYLGNIGCRNGWGEEQAGDVLAKHLEIISSARTTRIEQQYADGRVLSIACQPMPGGGAILTYDDLTEQRAAKAKIEHMAYHDALTGLPNRRYLAEKMSERVAQRPSSGAVALLHIDLDGFKQINDSLGHPAGDKVLCHVADVLRDTVRRNDIAVRIGGDEFVVFCEAGTELDSLTGIAQRIISKLSRPLHIDGKVCRFGASIGIAREKRDGLDCEALMSRADLALYDAKRSGRGCMSVFTEAMEEQILAANHLRDDIQRGIEAGEFRSVYHPQFDARTLDLVGVEALARWHHPVRGILAPDAFLGIAEELGVIDAIDAAILGCAVDDQARWVAAGHDVPKISVNVSARRLRSAGLVEMVRALNLPHGVITFELLESIDLDEPDAISAWNIDGLRDLGVDIEIDDFGTGRTSIVSLVRLRPSRLKIDRQLVAPIVHSDAALNLVASIIEIGRTLGIGVTAEGVETMAHVHKLRGIGCGVLQGFAFSKPLTADAIASFLSSQEWRAA